MPGEGEKKRHTAKYPLQLCSPETQPKRVLSLYYLHVLFDLKLLINMPNLAGPHFQKFLQTQKHLCSEECTALQCLPLEDACPSHTARSSAVSPVRFYYKNFTITICPKLALKIINKFLITSRVAFQKKKSSVSEGSE